MRHIYPTSPTPYTPYNLFEFPAKGHVILEARGRVYPPLPSHPRSQTRGKKERNSSGPQSTSPSSPPLIKDTAVAG
ncbi:hypothetical protein VNO78_30511 [Psophocarpus tetragonolobus]|uniref:Uncharacterized protein n=1 Tax=Psophocarpus tetragonolobus TaxID=3891 RepID=A0AAN9X4W7_PSOTE